jgi:hypothetical protein
VNCVVTVPNYKNGKHGPDIGIPESHARNDGNR